MTRLIGSRDISPDIHYSICAAPRVFGLGSGLGCGLGFAFVKSLERLQIYPRVNLSILGTNLGQCDQNSGRLHFPQKTSLSPAQFD